MSMNSDVAAKAAEALKFNWPSALVDAYGELWNTVQGIDAFTNLSSVSDGCSYNLHSFTISGEAKSGAGDGRADEVDPESTHSGGEPPASSGSSSEPSRLENDPIPIVDPGNQRDQSGAGRSSRDLRPKTRPTQETGPTPPGVYPHVNLLIARDYYREGIQGEAIFELFGFVRKDSATCTIRLSELRGFDTKVGNQLAVEFDSTVIASGGVVLWMKGLFNPAAFGYAHFAAAFELTLTNQGTIEVHSSPVVLAGDLNAIQDRSSDSTIVLESGR